MIPIKDKEVNLEPSTESEEWRKNNQLNLKERSK